MARIRALRGRCFGAAAAEADPRDADCAQVLIEERSGGVLAGTFRYALFSGGDLPRSYAAGFYDLAALSRYRGTLLELGRFCLDPVLRDPDLTRIAWSVLAREVDRRHVRMLFGCTSFRGTDPLPCAAAFAWLGARHSAPRRWAPGPGAGEIVRFASIDPAPTGDREAKRQTPALLRSYLSLGARVSDHAVIDREMNTMHVFTGLEVSRIPQARKQRLQALFDFLPPAGVYPAR